MIRRGKGGRISLALGIGLALSAGASDFSATENESGSYGQSYDAPPGKPAKDSLGHHDRSPEEKNASVPDPAAPKAGIGPASPKGGPAASPGGGVADSSAPDSSEAGGGEPDSSAPDGASGIKEADMGAPDSGASVNPALDSLPSDRDAADSGASGGNATTGTRSRFAEAPSLILLPMVVAKGTSGGNKDFEAAEAGLRLGLAQSLRYTVWTREQADASGKDGRPMPFDCFSRECLAESAHRTRGAFLVAAEYSSRDSVRLLKVVLAEVPDGRIIRAVQVWGRPRSDGIIPFARETAMRLAIPDWGRDYRRGEDGSNIDGSFHATRQWREVPWLNPKDTVDNRRHWRWAGSGLLLAGAGLAYAQGQWLQEDANRTRPLREVLSGAGAQSFLRGFFAAPTLGARYAAMGGAGMAQVGSGLALLMNPAGVAEADRENVVAAKRSLPDGTPSVFLGYAGPLFGPWSQGVGMQFEGDRLANETTLHGALGYDLGSLSKGLSGIRIGAQSKLYLAQVGEAGEGLDRSTGRSFGLGLDLGMQARLNERITAGLAVRDVLSFLRHSNTLTNESYAEVLPVEYRIGAAYEATPSLLLLMDGQKGIWADQADHLRLGGEQRLFDFLALRCGLHEIFGREAVRKLSLGFGLDTGHLSDKSAKVRLGLNYAYEFGLDEDEALGAGQQFSLDASF